MAEVKCPNCDFSGWVPLANGDYVLGDAEGLTIATVTAKDNYVFGFWTMLPFTRSEGYTTKEAAMAAAEAYLESVRPKCATSS